VGPEGTVVQGGDVGAVGTVVQKEVGDVCTVDQKDVGPLGTVDQKDVVAAGSVWKSWHCPGKGSISDGSNHSAVNSPGLKVSDPVLGVGDSRCAGDIPSSPWCATSRPHEHTPGGAVPSGTVSDPEVKTRPPWYMVAEVFFLSDEGTFSRTDSLPPELPYSGTIIGMGLDGIPENSPALAKTAQNIPGVLECCEARLVEENVFLCAQEFYHEAWEALLNVPSVCGTMMYLPWIHGGSPGRGEHAESFLKNQRKFPAQETVTDEAQVVLKNSQEACEAS